MAFLSATAKGEWYEAIARVRSSVEGCGFVLEERPFSGILVNFHVELFPGCAARWGRALVEKRVILDEESAERLRALEQPSAKEIQIMLAVTFPDGDPEKRQESPAVPG